MDALDKALRVKGKNRLADCIEKNSQKAALPYSRELNTYSPARPMEPEMRNAFRRELERIGENNIEAILQSLERRRILQTTPHLGATNTARMLTINWLSSLGVPVGEFYVAGVYSQIPFSNNSRPGRINMKTEAVNLFLSSMQDDLVFRSKIPEKLPEVVKTLPEALKKFLPEAKPGDSYTKWALQTCANIERKILKKDNLVYLDINEVIANYLEEIKGKPDHPMNKLKDEENLFATFAVLLINHFKCFGSFRQVEYLPVYQERLARMEILQGYGIERVPTANLTTGELAEPLCPADLVTLGREFSPDPNMLFGELITNMMTPAWLAEHI